MEPLHPDQVARGRRIALTISALLVGFELLALFALSRVAPDDVTRPVVRTVLTAALAVALYRGFAWARWGLLALVLAGFLLGNWTWQWPMLILLVIYVVIGRTLLYSDALRAFMRHQRGKPPSPA